METEEKWDRRFLSLAREVGSWSKDPSTKCGAILVNDLRQVVGMGYNGFPRYVVDSAARYEHRETKYKLVVHAEVNAILQAGHAARGCTLYVHPSFMMPPICRDCAKCAIQAGIKTIVGYLTQGEEAARALRWFDSIQDSAMMFEEAGINWRSIKCTNG